jgi:hypothetical protein
MLQFIFCWLNSVSNGIHKPFSWILWIICFPYLCQSQEAVRRIYSTDDLDLRARQYDDYLKQETVKMIRYGFPPGFGGTHRMPLIFFYDNKASAFYYYLHRDQKNYDLPETRKYSCSHYNEYGLMECLLPRNIFYSVITRRQVIKGQQLKNWPDGPDYHQLLYTYMYCRLIGHEAGKPNVIDIHRHCPNPCRNPNNLLCDSDSLAISGKCILQVDRGVYMQQGYRCECVSSAVWNDVLKKCVLRNFVSRYLADHTPRRDDTIHSLVYSYLQCSQKGTLAVVISPRGKETCQCRSSFKGSYCDKVSRIPKSHAPQLPRGHKLIFLSNLSLLERL